MSTGVLIVEDEFLIAETLTAMVEDIGMSVCGAAATACEAVRLARIHEPLLVLMDVRLKGQKDGIDAAREIRTLKFCPVIFITGSQEPQTIERIKSENLAAGLLFKPFQFGQLKAMIKQVLC